MATINNNQAVFDQASAYYKANPNSSAGSFVQQQGTPSQGVLAPTTAVPTSPVGVNGTTPTGNNLAPKATMPVVTSKMAQDDYNTKYANYQKLVADLETRANVIGQQKAMEENAKAQDDLEKAKINIQQQGIDLKRAEVDAKNKALGLASGDGSTSNTTTTPTTTTAPTSTTVPTNDTPTTNTTSPETSAFTSSMNKVQDARTQAIQQYQTQVSQIMNGTFPLSTEENALINSVQQSLERQKASVIGVENMAAARGGQEYTPQQMIGNLANKVMNLDAMAAGTMANLKMGFMKQDYQMINDSYEKQQKYLDDKVQTIQKLHDTVLAQEKTQRDEQQKVTDSINKIAQEASKNGATPDQVAKITASKSESEAINNAGGFLQTGTGVLGDYLQYKRDTQAKGLTPLDFESYKIQEENRKNQLDIKKSIGDKNQQKLEQQYRGVLSKEFSSRTGSLGIENAKVNQANHLNSLVTQYYDPKTGDYNVPKAQYAELVLGLASLVAPNGTTAAQDRAELMSRTSKGDLAGAIQYITGTTPTGNSQEIIKNLVDSIDRQAQTAIQNREVALQNMRDQAPTDLDPKRVDILNKSTQMVKYSGEDRIHKTNIDNYVRANPKEAENIAKLYETPGATNKDIEEYLRANGKI